MSSPDKGSLALRRLLVLALPVFILAAAANQGCPVSVFAKGYRTTIDFKGDSLGSAAVDWDDETYANVVWGAVELTDPIPLGEVCRYGTSYVEYMASPGDTFINGVTFGIYTPLSVSVFCSEGLAYQLQVDDQGRATKVEKVGHWEYTQTEETTR